MGANSVIQALRHAARVVAYENEPDKAAQKLLDVAVQVSRAETGVFLRLADASAGDVCKLYAAPASAKPAYSLIAGSLELSQFGQSVKRVDGLAWGVPDAVGDKWLAVFKERLAVRSCLFAPVISPNTRQVVGVIVLAHSDACFFSDAAEAAVEALAHQCALALENARLYKESKSSEKLLKEQTQQYRSIFKAATDAILVFDREGNIVDANPAACDMHGYEYEDMVCLHGKDIIHHEDRRLFFNFLNSVEEREHFKAAGSHIRKDGGRFFVEVVGSLFYHKGASHMLTIVRDVTHEKRSREALQDQEERIRLAAEAAGLGAWDYYPQTDQLIWCSQCRRLFGIQGQDPVDYNFFLQCLHPEDRNRVNESVRRTLDPELKERFDVEYRAVANDGSEKWIKATGKAFFGDDGLPLRFIGIVQDVTEKKAGEASIREQQQMLEMVNQDLQNFAYAISHDIKNPLSSLILASRLGRKFTTVEQFREIMPGIEANSTRINEIIEGMLKIINAEREQDKAEEIYLPEIIARLSEENRGELAAAEGHIEIDLDVKKICYIPGYVQSVLRNLISNSIKYRSAERPLRVEVSTRRLGAHTVLCVSDNGTGIDVKRYKKELFKPFRRFSKNGKGSGLGLFMIKRMIEKNGGRIEVDSRPGQGTTFTCYFVEYINLPHGSRELSEAPERNR